MTSTGWMLALCLTLAITSVGSNELASGLSPVQQRFSHERQLLFGNRAAEVTDADTSVHMPAGDLPREGIHASIETFGNAARHSESENDVRGRADSGTHPKVPILSILLYTTLMAMASGLGAIPFFIFGKLKPYWAGIANAVAVGVMLSASFDLLHEGAPYSPPLTILGMVIGSLFIKSSQDYLSQFEDTTFEDLQGADARKAMLIIAVMAAHAFGEGSGVGVSFSGQRGWAKGLLVTIAIGLHNVPEGMAVAGVMMSKGSSPRKALYWTLMCSMPQALVSVPAYIFVETFSFLLPVALGFAAGCMIWIAFAELIPDALEAADHGHVATAATFSAAWLQGLSMLISTLEEPSGALASPVQADPSILTRHLGALLPCILAPCAAAALASLLFPSLPVLIGAAAGSQAWIGAAALLGLVITSRASLLPAVFCAVGGACLAAMMLSATRASDSESSNEDSKACNGHHGGKQEWTEESQSLDALRSRQSRGHIEGVTFEKERNGLHTNGESFHPTDVHMRTHLEASRPGYNGWGASRPAYDHSTGGALEGGKAHPLKYPTSSDFLELSLPQYQNDKHHPSVGNEGSASFAAAVLVTHGIPLGLALARTIAANPDAASLSALLPCTLSAVNLGLASAGLGRALSGTRSWKVPVALAGGLACATWCTAACFLVSLPLGRQDDATIWKLAVAMESWVPLVEAAVAGAMLLASAAHTWPLASAYRAKRGLHGFGLAMCLGMGTSLFQVLLCASTPYCLK